MAVTYAPPTTRITKADAGAAAALRSMPSLAAQVSWLLVIRWKPASEEKLVLPYPNLRRLNILAEVLDFLSIADTETWTLGSLRIFELQSVDVGSADGVAVIDRLVGHMPSLRELKLGVTCTLTSVLPRDNAEPVYSHITHITLERYEISALFDFAGLPLLCSQNSLRVLYITMDDSNGAGARESLLRALGRVTLHRVRHLALVNRDRRLPANFALRLLAACPALRSLELNTCRIALDTYDLLDSILRASGTRLSTLCIYSNGLFAEQTAKTLLLHVQRMRMLRALVLRRGVQFGDSTIEPLRHACRMQRISFLLEGNEWI